MKDPQFPRSRGDNIFFVNIMKLMIHMTIKELSENLITSEIKQAKAITVF